MRPGPALAGPAPPAPWLAYPGHYRAQLPYYSNYRVVIRQGVLLLLTPEGYEETLVPLGHGEFRVGQDVRSPGASQVWGDRQRAGAAAQPLRDGILSDDDALRIGAAFRDDEVARHFHQIARQEGARDDREAAGPAPGREQRVGGRDDAPAGPPGC